MRRLFIVTFFLGCMAAQAWAATTVRIYEMQPDNTSGMLKLLGTVTAEQTAYGVLLTPDLQGLPTGIHGFHLHQYPSCKDQGQAAGGHLDPKGTGKHLGPYNKNGHLGDLPVLYVDEAGRANTPVLAPRLHISDLQGRALIIHAGGDSYSDAPEVLGGGGTRIACGKLNFLMS